MEIVFLNLWTKLNDLSSFEADSSETANSSNISIYEIFSGYQIQVNRE